MPKYFLFNKTKQIEAYYNAKFSKKHEPFTNANPFDQLPVITQQAPNEIQHFHWGLVQNDGWHDKTILTFESEQAIRNKHLRRLLHQRKCVIPAGGYFEFLKLLNIMPIPFAVKLKRDLLSFAGVWDSWEDLATGKTVNSFAILTMPIVSKLAVFGGRMPVIIPQGDERKYLRSNLPTDFFCFNEADSFDFYPVDDRVTFGREKKVKIKRMGYSYDQRSFRELDRADLVKHLQDQQEKGNRQRKKRSEPNYGLKDHQDMYDYSSQIPSAW